jgi:hypothetical protein
MTSTDLLAAVSRAGRATSAEVVCKIAPRDLLWGL